jgi:gluconate 2-dehydrogenase gamma chain
LIGRLDQRQIAEIEQSEAAGFFELVWQHLREGLFADPIHGGNRDLAGWKLIGFPGAYANYYELVDRHNYRFAAPPLGIG